MRRKRAAEGRAAEVISIPPLLARTRGPAHPVARLLPPLVAFTYPLFPGWGFEVCKRDPPPHQSEPPPQRAAEHLDHKVCGVEHAAGCIRCWSSRALYFCSSWKPSASTPLQLKIRDRHYWKSRCFRELLAMHLQEKQVPGAREDNWFFLLDLLKSWKAPQPSCSHLQFGRFWHLDLKVMPKFFPTVLPDVDKLTLFSYCTMK